MVKERISTGQRLLEGNPVGEALWVLSGMAWWLLGFSVFGRGVCKGVF